MGGCCSENQNNFNPIPMQYQEFMKYVNLLPDVKLIN